MTTTIHSFFRVGALFVPVADFRGRIREELYIEGAIELSIDGRPMITRVEHDLVDQLWAYLITLCTDVEQGRVAKTSFPDQPIDMALTPKGSRVELTLRYPGVERRASEDRAVFFDAIGCSAVAFFDVLFRVAPQRKPVWERAVERAARLRSPAA